MEEEEGGSSACVVQGIRGYFQRRGYRRLEGSQNERGGGRRQVWRRRMRVRPRLQLLRRLSPVRFLGRIRDAYVKMMMSMANSRVFAGGGYGGLGGGGGGGWGSGFTAPPPLKEYDDKVIVEIYKIMLHNDMPTVGAAADICR